MIPSRVIQRPSQDRTRITSFTATIHAVHPTYARKVYTRTLHPNYIPWVQAVFHPVIARYILPTVEYVKNFPESAS